MALREQYRWKVSGHARRLVDDLFRTPFVTVPEAQQALGVSNATARKAVLELQEWGMLEELAARRWPRAYIARPILDAIQAPLEDLRLRSEAKPKGAPLKTGTDLEEPPEKPAERHMAEAMALIDEARRWGVQVRLMGGLAVRRYCTDLGFMDREYSDIDLVGLSVQNRELHEVFTRLGYAENRAVTEATGAGQLQYVKTEVLEGAGGAYRIGAGHGDDRPAPLVDHVDLFMDVMRMDHDLDVRDRLLVDDYAISPADAFIGKLQIGRLNAKDAHDVIALLKDVPLRQADDETSLCLPYVAETCASDWGLCQDVLDQHRRRPRDGRRLRPRRGGDRSCVRPSRGAARGHRGRGEVRGLAAPRPGRQARGLAARHRGHRGHGRHRAGVGLAPRPRLTPRRPRGAYARSPGHRLRQDRANERRQTMAYVLIEHRVGDFETFRQVYLDDAERRERLGSQGGVVFRVADDPDNVIVMLEWDTVERARDFAGSLELEQAMEWSTSNVATPRVTVLDEVDGFAALRPSRYDTGRHARRAEGRGRNGVRSPRTRDPRLRHAQAGLHRRRRAPPAHGLPRRTHLARGGRPQPR